MSAKAILVFCAQALFVQSALSQCTSRAAVAAEPLIAPAAMAAPYGIGAPFAYDGLASPYGYAASPMAAQYGLAGLYETAPCAWATPAMDFTPTSGGAFPVSSASDIPPVGLSVVSENFYEGVLAAAGEAPFVGTVAVEGVLPTAGASAVNHACGNGINAMTSGPAAFTPAYADAIAPAAAADAIAPAAAAIAPAAAAAIAPSGGFAPGFGNRAGWAGRGCGGYAM